MKVYFAADHASFELKNELLAFVRDELKKEVEDCGAFVLDQNDDYPGIIAEAAQKLSMDSRWGKDNRAIVLGGSGQGEAMAANRFKGVRCALYYGSTGEQTDASGKKLDMIASTREHNNANALSLGGRFISVADAKDVVKRWLSLPYSGEDRHARRIAQLDTLN